MFINYLESHLSFFLISILIFLITLSFLKYYSVNVAGSIHLVEVMEEFNVKKIVFSSSSTVLGEPEYLPVDEIHPTGKCINVYGRTKYFFEEFLKDLTNSNKSGDDQVKIRKIPSFLSKC